MASEDRAMFWLTAIVLVLCGLALLVVWANADVIDGAMIAAGAL